MALSYFTNREKHPVDQDLQDVLAITSPYWREIIDFCYQHFPDISEEWNYSGKNYGWSLRIKSKKRNILYLIPCQGYFKFAFVFGKNAVEKIFNSNINQQIKLELSAARTYTEGTGFRMDVHDNMLLKDIKELIRIKIET